MTKKTRIVIDGEVLVNDHFSGIGHYTLDLLRTVDELLETRKDISVTIFVFFKRLAMARAFGFKNISVIPSPMPLRVTNGLKRRRIQPPLDTLFGKGVYVFPNYSSWPLAFSKSIPIIYDVSFELYPQFAAPQNQKFLSEQTKISAKRADAIVTISQNSKNEIESLYHYDSSHISVLYPAVDRKRYYRRNKVEIDEVKNKYGVDGEYILFVGNIEPRKNLTGILLAYEQLPQKLRKKYSLLLVGAKGWQDSEIFDVIDRLLSNGNHVLFPSTYVNDDDIPALYSGAKLFVYPSFYEGFGMPPLEALACETPVVTSNNSSLPEVVDDAALTVSASSTEDIANAMESLLTNGKLRATCVEKGLQQIEHFSWSSSAEKLLDLAKDVA